MRRPLLSLVIAAGLSVIACSEQPTETRQDSFAPQQPSSVTAAACLSPSDINVLITALFPAGPLRQSALSQFKSIPPKTNKPTGTAARDKVFAFIDFVLKNYFAGKLIVYTSTPDTKTRVQTLIIAVDCYSGVPPQTIPLDALNQDGAAAVITPTSATTVETATKHAGVQFPLGSVSQPVLVTITRLPDGPPGPLPTSLDQFPRFYEFSSSPEVTFNHDFLAGVCLQNDPANAGDLRLAHKVGPNFGDVEILPFASAGFLDCTTPDPTFGSTTGTGWNHFAWAKALLLPAELHATTTALLTTGVGGIKNKFSPFGAVDPGSNPGKILFNPDEATFTGLSAPPGGTVSPAPSVKVTSENGDPINIVPVVFAVTGGGGTITGGTTINGTTATVFTNVNGIASLTSWTLGPQPGTNTVTATPPNLDATAGPPPHPAVKFSPTSLTFTATAAGPPFGFENGEQEFAATGFWNRNTFAGLSNSAYPTYVTTVGSGFPVPPQGSYAAWYGQPSTGNYIGTQASGDASGSGGTSTTPNTGTFVSPPFTVPDVDGLIQLEFKTWWEIESVNPATFDLMSIELENTGTNAVSVLGRLNPESDPEGGAPALPFTSGGFNTAPAWQDVAFDISAFRGQAVRLRFDFNTGDNLYNGFRGWIVDDVRVGVGPSFFVAPKLSAERAAVGKLAPADRVTFPVRTPR